MFYNIMCHWCGYTSHNIWQHCGVFYDWHVKEFGKSPFVPDE